MLGATSHILDFSEHEEWLASLKNGSNEYILRSYLNHNKHITHLSFFSCGLSDKDLKIILAVIQKCPHIQSLDIANNQFTADGIKLLANKLEQLHLKELDISGNYHAGIAAIHELTAQVSKTKLETLKLNRIMLHGGCRRIFADLQNSESLRRLEMNTTGLDHADALDVAVGLNSCQQMRFIDLSSNSLIDASIDLITRHLSCRDATLMLNELDVSYNPLTPAVLSILAHNITDTTLTKILYDGLMLPPELLAELTAAVDFNQTHNEDAQLSKAFNEGDSLKVLEKCLSIPLPFDSAEDIAASVSQSSTQARAFLRGWIVRNNLMLAQDEHAHEVIDDKVTSSHTLRK